MSDRPVTLLALLLVLAATAPGGALAAPDAGDGTAAGDIAVGQPENDTANDTVGFGASVSAFVQTSAANAEGEVDDGVFSARFENASNETRDRLVRQRTARLAEQVDGLRERRATLLNATGNLTVAERARAARLAARIDSLRSTLNVTEDAARTAGVDDPRLAILREVADELSGPEVAEIARGLAGGPDRDRGNGPPEDAPGNRTDGPGEGPPEDGDRGQDGDDEGDDPDRGQGNGPPGDDGAGEGSEDEGEDRGQGNGPPDGEDRGQGNGPPEDGNRGQGDDEAGGDDEEDDD
jgi:hypothetical protein